MRMRILWEGFISRLLWKLPWWKENQYQVNNRVQWSRWITDSEENMIQKITRFKFRWDEEDFQEGRPKQTVSQQDRPQCNAFRTEVYRNEKKKRYWRKILLQKQQYFMFCVWMNMSQGLVRENAKYRGTSKSVGGGPWNASRESW